MCVIFSVWIFTVASEEHLYKLHTSAWSGNSNGKKGNEIYNLIMQIFDYNLIWWLSYYERNTLKIYLYNASIIAGRDLLPGTVLSQHNYKMPFTFASG